MNENKHIPQGYKNSPLGIIPEEWEVKKICDFGKVITGNTPPTKDVDNYGSTYMFVSPADITENKYIKSSERKLSRKGFSLSRIMPKDSVLFTCIGSTIGKCAIANEDLTSNQQINAIICNSNHNEEFLYYELNRRSSRIKLIAGEQAVPIINKSTFENIKILCPPLEEQIQICSVLQLWDTAIEKQSVLIEKLKLRKRALMQQLLTSKKRLPGFSGEWREVKLGEIAERISRKNEEDNKNVVTISAQRGFVVQTDFFNKSVASEILDNYYLIHKDEFCYNKSYSTGYPMGVIKRLKSFNKAVVTTLYICFKLKKESLVNIDFFEQFCESGILNQELIKVANEGGRAHGLLNVTSSDFFNMYMSIPNIEEQNAIATVLVNANKEIELANKKLANMQFQKRGLMQQLLTGKKRIIK